MRFLAFDKLSQAIPIVLTIILLTLWRGDDLGSLFLKKGNLRQGLKFGLISFAIFAVIFIVIVVVQAKWPKNPGIVRFRDTHAYCRQRNPLDIDVLFC